MMKRAEPQDIVAMARIAGVTIDSATGERIARSIGPAPEGFAPVGEQLPFDLEPASFVTAQFKDLRS